MKSKPCKSGRRRRADGKCSRKPGRKRSSPCRYGVKKSGACRKKSGRKSRRRSASRSSSRKSSRSSRKGSRKSPCKYGRKKSGGCKKRPGPKKGSRRGSAKADPYASPVKKLVAPRRDLHELARLPSVRRALTVHSSPVARELARRPSVPARARSPVRRASGVASVGGVPRRPFILDESPVKTPAGYARLPAESPVKYGAIGPALPPSRRAHSAFGMCSN